MINDKYWNLSTKKIIKFIKNKLFLEELPKLFGKDILKKIINNNDNNYSIHLDKNYPKYTDHDHPKQKILGLLGKKGHGKDTVADYLVKKYGYYKLSFADPLKQLCSLIFKLNNDQLYGNKKEIFDDYWKTTPRKILQMMGTDLCRKHISKNIWINIMEKRIKNINSVINIVIADVRFQNEVDFIQHRCLNSMVLKINRYNIINNNTNIDIHQSETGIDSITNYSLLIENNSTLKELYIKIQCIGNKLGLHKNLYTTSQKC